MSETVSCLVVNGEVEKDHLTINEDLIIKTSSRLIVNRNLLVHGDVTLENGAQLIVKGSLEANKLNASTNSDTRVDEDVTLQDLILQPKSNLAATISLTVTGTTILGGDNAMNSNSSKFNRLVLPNKTTIHSDNQSVNESISVVKDSGIHAQEIVSKDLTLGENVMLVCDGNMTSETIKMEAKSCIRVSESLVAMSMYMCDYSKLYVDGNLVCPTIKATFYNEINILGNVFIRYSLSLTSSSKLIIGGHLQVGELFTMQNSSLEVKNGNVITQCLLVISSTITINNDLYIQEELTVRGDTIMNSNVVVTGDVLLSRYSTLLIKGNAQAICVNLGPNTRLEVCKSIFVQDNVEIPDTLFKNLLEDDSWVKQYTNYIVAPKRLSPKGYNIKGLVANIDTDIEIGSNMTAERLLRLDNGSKLEINGHLKTNGIVMINSLLNSQNFRKPKETRLTVNGNASILGDILNISLQTRARMIIDGNLIHSMDKSIRANLLDLQKKNALFVQGTIVSK